MGRAQVAFLNILGTAPQLPYPATFASKAPVHTLNSSWRFHRGASSCRQGHRRSGRLVGCRQPATIVPVGPINLRGQYTPRRRALYTGRLSIAREALAISRRRLCAVPVRALRGAPTCSRVSASRPDRTCRGFRSRDVPIPVLSCGSSVPTQQANHLNCPRNSVGLHMYTAAWGS